MKKSIYSVLLILLLSIILNGSVFGQVVIDRQDDSNEAISADRIGSFYTVLPIGGYSSDWGFYGGGFFQRINYDMNVRPFLSILKADFSVSTKGYIVTQLDYERTETFGLNLRSRVEFIGQRIREGHFFGLGNNTQFNSDLFDDNFYFYENRELYIKYIARKKISDLGKDGFFDLYGSTTFWTVNAVINDESLIAIDRPAGLQNGHVAKLGIGIIADSRDSEFTPTRGFHYEVGLNTTPGLINSEYSYSELIADVRHYVNPFWTVVLAHRFKIEGISGDAPFWALPIIGDQYGLRGYYLNRFRGDRTVLQSAEIRSWLFSVWNNQITVGSVLFWDSGRIFSEYDSAAFFSDWKHTFGVGAVFTLFGPDMILRADVGFSDESMRIYFGSGFNF